MWQIGSLWNLVTNVQLPVNKSEDPDLIPSRIAYEMRQETAQPLTMLFNRSLESNQVPKN